MRLYAPQEYWNAPPQVLEEVVGGCGPGGFGDVLVPDNIDWPWPWGLSIKEACKIHDWMYFTGETLEDKEKADRVFLNNMTRIINDAGGFWLVRKRRLARAWIYYKAVDRFGGPAFWDGKNKEDEEQEVEVWRAGLLVG